MLFSFGLQPGSPERKEREVVVVDRKGRKTEL